MTIRKTSLIGAVIAAVVCVGLQAAPAVAAAPHPTSAPVALPVGASAQVVHEAAVVAFLADHAAPAALTASASPAELAENRNAWLAFLKAAAWVDFFGQWGCTVSNLNAAMTQAGDGNMYPTVQDVADCGGVEALTGVVGNVRTKASVLAEPGSAQLRAELAAVASP